MTFQIHFFVYVVKRHDINSFQNEFHEKKLTLDSSTVNLETEINNAFIKKKKNAIAVFFDVDMIWK